MKRLVLVGEGHGDALALPTLVRKLLREKETDPIIYVDDEVIRESSPVKWDKERACPDFRKWIARVTLASRKRETGAVLAVYDGDLPSFPPGSGSAFCAAQAAKSMAAAAREARAGEIFSLAVVFACTEYETWLVAGIESLSGRRFKDGRAALPPGLVLPPGPVESHGKRWLEEVFPGYRPALHQSELTEMLDLNLLRKRKVRSLQRLEHALEELLSAANSGRHIVSPH